jgi:hypothetical protein
VGWEVSTGLIGLAHPATVAEMKAPTAVRQDRRVHGFECINSTGFVRVCDEMTTHPAGQISGDTRKFRLAIRSQNHIREWL